MSLEICFNVSEEFCADWRVYTVPLLMVNPYLCQLETKLLRDYALIHDQEEIFWKQKSRNTWLRHGDKNTHFSIYLQLSGEGR